jgi:hypothetical protein
MKSLGKIGRTLVEALREIFDEAAYLRFLQRTRSSSSAATYAAFCRERELSSARRHRCC